MTTIDPTVRDVHAVWTRLRESAPVCRVSLPGGADVWLVTRYDDVRAALADPRLSLSKTHARHWRGLSLPPALDTNLLNMDPPQHTRIRRLVSTAFTPRRVEALRPRVAAIAADLLDAMADRAGCDLVEAYAAPLPIATISELLGVPEGERATLRARTVQMLSAESAGSVESARSAMVALHRYMVELIRHKRRTPGDDLVSDLIAARDAGDRLSEDELLSLAFLVLFAGYENTVNLISTGVLLHLRRAAPVGSLPAFVDEVLRFEPPAPVAIRRFPVTDVEIGGVVIPAGETVLLGVAPANRDPDRVAAPDVFDPDRDHAPHLSFGHGIHYCVGAALARVEAEVAIGALLERYPRLALAVSPDELAWFPSFRTRSLVALPVVY